MELNILAGEMFLCFLLVFNCVHYIGVAGCLINPCMIPTICKGKTCVLDDNCSVRCVCDETSTLSECTNVTIAVALTSVTDVNGTTNMALTSVMDVNGTTNVALTSVTDATHTGCQCVHGNCHALDNNGVCVCDIGWRGDTCEIPCTQPCPVGSRCEFIPETMFTICMTATDTQETTTLTVSPTTEKSPNRTYNVCDPEYTLRPKTERICGGWPCLNGVCATDGVHFWCNCDPGGSGQSCQNMCCKQCIHGSCYYIKEEDREICNCYANYSGLYCESWDPPTEIGPPEEITWHYWVVGACALVLVILVALMVVVPYLLWRNRVILVMKVVHYFQGYEDDDDRQWDAFISYKSTKADETFVVKTLFPKLEREFGFKINVHFRDFVAGETIANNIISAVQGSRRTIMIITPSYITSEFTKFEYQVAQQEMLKRRHRIIPILLEDITECKETMDPNLKVILNSVTYIQWPQDGSEKKLEKFWKRIDLSMPKIKNRPIDSDHANCQTNGIATMTKPDDIKLSIPSDRDKSITDVSNGNNYTIIPDNKVEPEEVYDMLNESEMESKVIKKKADSRQNSKQEIGHIVLKI